MTTAPIGDVEFLESKSASYLFTRAEVERITGFSAASIIRFADRGLLKETRLPSGRGVRSSPRYTKAAVAAFVASGYGRPRPRRTH